MECWKNLNKHEHTLKKILCKKKGFLATYCFWKIVQVFYPHQLFFSIYTFQNNPSHMYLYFYCTVFVFHIDIALNLCNIDSFFLAIQKPGSLYIYNMHLNIYVLSAFAYKRKCCVVLCCCVVLANINI